MINELNKYLANQAILITKLHNLHWNVKGEQFKPVHIHTEGLYNAFFEGFDEVAELIRQRDAFPAASLSEYLKLATIKELKDSKAISCSDALKIVFDDLNSMRNQILELRKIADKEGDFVIVSYCEDQIKFYDKEIWFLKATLNK